MKKPEPECELFVEESEACDRCLILYAVTAGAQAFVAQCAGFGKLDAIGDDAPPSGMAAFLTPLAGPPRVAPRPTIVHKIHVWPNYNKAQVLAWIKAWPHVADEWEAALADIKADIRRRADV